MKKMMKTMAMMIACVMLMSFGLSANAEILDIVDGGIIVDTAPEIQPVVPENTPGTGDWVYDGGYAPVYRVTFYDFYGLEYAYADVERSYCVMAPDVAPVLEGHTFAYWFDGQDETMAPFVFENAVLSDIALYPFYYVGEIVQYDIPDYEDPSQPAQRILGDGGATTDNATGQMTTSDLTKDILREQVQQQQVQELLDAVAPIAAQSDVSVEDMSIVDPASDVQTMQASDMQLMLAQELAQAVLTDDILMDADDSDSAAQAEAILDSMDRDALLENMYSDVLEAAKNTALPSADALLTIDDDGEETKDEEKRFEPANMDGQALIDLLLEGVNLAANGEEPMAETMELAALEGAEGAEQEILDLEDDGLEEDALPETETIDEGLINLDDLEDTIVLEDEAVPLAGPNMPYVTVDYKIDESDESGKTVTVVAVLHNIPEGVEPSFQWQNDAEGEFEDVESANGETYTFSAEKISLVDCNWRVTVDLKA